LLVYIAPMSSIFGGHSTFNIFMGVLSKLPLYSVVELLLFFMFIFHFIMIGILAYSSSINIVQYNYYGNWMYVLKRLSGVLIVPFMAYFFYMQRFGFILSGSFPKYADIHKILSSGAVSVLYIIGIISIVVYMGSSIVSTFLEWGVNPNGKASRFLQVVVWLITLVLSAWGVRIIISFS